MTRWMPILCLFCLINSPVWAQHQEINLDFIFPTFEKPTASYLHSPRKFAANRSGGRLHAACDLYQTAKGQAVRAITSSRVIRDLYYFYQGTYAMELKLESGEVLRYGEITGQRPPGFDKSRPLNIGQILGYVGKVSSNCCDPMLHFEKYSGRLTGALSQSNGTAFRRRKDLQNPTEELLRWEESTFRPAPFELVLAPPLGELPPSLKPLPTDTKSLENVLRALVKILQTPMSPVQLVKELAKYDIQTQMKVDSNPDTGTMTLIQSIDRDTSAHHVHAQYFADQDQAPFLQHISFELVPGVRTLGELTEDVRTAFSGLGTPESQSEDFIQWSLPEHRILWIKKLSAEDLKESPFYTYSAQEVGSLRLSIELDHD